MTKVFEPLLNLDGDSKYYRRFCVPIWQICKAKCHHSLDLFRTNICLIYELIMV